VEIELEICVPIWRFDKAMAVVEKAARQARIGGTAV
jgi:hypothetical protein